MASKNTPATPAISLPDAVRAALVEIDGAITGHTGNNLVENAYRHQGFRLSLAEVMDWLAAGLRIYDGPSRTEFAAMGKVTNEQRAAWYHIPDRAGAGARVAATLSRYGLAEDHPVTLAPGQSEVKAALGSAEPLAKLAEIHAEAAKKEAERIKAEREQRIKDAVKTAKAVADFGGDPALVWAKAIEQGADAADLRQAFTNAGLTPPAA
ncbi:hypothetical protein FXF51_01790 [Nonomuraea sp. PA05]|uniref:hypothetical protein n=1 Tax=Nonomuraea sp. PA05 TaxID=2604466 RepID=UPI0011D4EA4D|nr:hypothetical protein [Nonomuraea sp. PA05]TYB71193.1 hypothetical protein FXF51_01790 [Nonomuraea sp. PA05]